MRKRTHRTAFDLGSQSAKEPGSTNPYQLGSVEHRNFELGRAHGLQGERGVFARQLSSLSAANPG